MAQSEFLRELGEGPPRTQRLKAVARAGNGEQEILTAGHAEVSPGVRGEIQTESSVYPVLPTLG